MQTQHLLFRAVFLIKVLSAPFFIFIDITFFFFQFSFGDIFLSRGGKIEVSLMHVVCKCIV